MVKIKLQVNSKEGFKSPTGDVLVDNNPLETGQKVYKEAMKTGNLPSRNSSQDYNAIEC